MSSVFVFAFVYTADSFVFAVTFVSAAPSFACVYAVFAFFYPAYTFDCRSLALVFGIASFCATFSFFGTAFDFVRNVAVYGPCGALCCDLWLDGFLDLFSSQIALSLC